MNVIINGKKRNIKSRRIEPLFKELDINPVGMLVEVNGRIVKWTNYARHAIREGDKIEILRFVGGG